MSVDSSVSRQHITEFLRNHALGVLATADSTGEPHSATIYVTHDQQLNLYFVTKKETQKSRNLQVNPRAALAIYDAKTQTTVQAEGTVSEIRDPDQQEWVFNDIWKLAFNMSRTAPPTTRINAGGYIAYKLVAPSIRIARFAIPTPNKEGEDTFETIHTQPPH